MKTYLSISIVGLLLLMASSGCVGSPIQDQASPLPVGSTEERANAYAQNLRTLNPSMTKAEAERQSAALAAGEDARAEAEWRQRQKADAKQQKFLKDLDTVTAKD